MGNLVFKIADIIYRFVVLNLIWLLFFLIGMGIFGFMPATVALFSVIRQWIKGEEDLRLFKMFFHYYKVEFIRSNILWLIFLVIFYIIYVNYSFISYYYSAGFHFFLYIILFSFAFIAFMTFVNLFSVIAHFEFKTIRYIKVAAGMVFLRPFNTLIQLLWLVVYYIISFQWPTVFIVLGVSVLAFILMATNYPTFIKHTPLDQQNN
ncbi:YesL family protein [Amphibacillus indicireducens]|uniref:YesL family protein n=1 Tax=Amphibacillus indicireducens TaxID=1076330 RepID=A0ABP7W4L1_9BACI